MITVYQMADNPYLTHTVVSVFTKTGMYLNESQAQWLIAQGKVVVDGRVCHDEAEILEPGLREFVIGERRVMVQLREVNVL